MKVTKMSVGVGVTVNLGNYENIKADAMVEAELESADSVERVEKTLNEYARIAVANQLADYVLEAASNYGLERFSSERSVMALLDRSAAYKVIKNLEPSIADATQSLLVEEWQQSRPLPEPIEDVFAQPADVTGAGAEPPVTLADLEEQAQQASDQLDAILDQVDADPLADSEYFGEYPEEAAADEETQDADDFDTDDDLEYDDDADAQPEHGDELDYDEQETPSPDDMDEFVTDSVAAGAEFAQIAEQQPYDDEAPESDTEVQSAEV